MVSKLFVVGDVHGEFDLLTDLLKHWNKEEEQLVFLGDLADRGPKSKECFQLVQSLVAAGEAVCVTGNHEDMILKFLDDPEGRLDWYLRNGAKETFESLFYEGVVDDKNAVELAQLLKEEYADLVQFIKGLPTFYEHELAICVHAGFDLTLSDFRATDRQGCIWIREPFYDSEVIPEKLIVHGHTPVIDIRGDQAQSHLLFHKNKLNIDGGAVYGGSLHGVVIGPEGIEADYQIYHPTHPWKRGRQ